MRELGLAPYFDALHGPADETSAEPKATTVARALPAIALVGDTRYDVEAARANGLRAIGVDVGHRRRGRPACGGSRGDRPHPRRAGGSAVTTFLIGGGREDDQVRASHTPFVQACGGGPIVAFALEDPERWEAAAAPRRRRRGPLPAHPADRRRPRGRGGRLRRGRPHPRLPGGAGGLDACPAACTTAASPPARPSPRAARSSAAGPTRAGPSSTRTSARTWARSRSATASGSWTSPSTCTRPSGARSPG